METILFVLLVALFGYLIKLGGRIGRIEEMLKQGSRGETAPEPGEKIAAAPPPPPRDEAVTTAQQPAAVSLEELSGPYDAAPEATTSAAARRDDAESSIPQQVVRSSGPDPIDRFIEWLKADWLAKAGALLLIIGFGWFVSYAFAEGWVGPQGRIAIGLMAGTALLVFGYWWIQRHPHQGSIFLVLGSTVILLTIWAARTMYDFFTPGIALVVMFLSVGFVSVTAVLRNNPHLAVVSLLLALGAPLLTNAPEPSLAGLFSYLLVISLGTLWAAVRTGWRYLLLIALGGLFFYSLPFLVDVPRGEAGIALLFAFVFTALFTLITFTAFLQKEQKLAMIDNIIIAGTGLYLFAWIEAAGPGEWESLLYASWSVVFTAVGYLVYRQTQKAEPFYLYAGVGVAYFVLATIAIFDGPALTVALTIEAALVPILGHVITRDLSLFKRLSLLMAAPALLSVPSIVDDAWYTGVPSGSLAVLLCACAAFIMVGALMFKAARQAEDSDSEYQALTHLVIGVVYALVLVWLIPQGLFAPNYDLGKLVSLTIYTILGIGVYITGHVVQEQVVRIAGGILVGGVIARLLLVEVWDMEMGLRIVTFFVVGILLMATALIERNKNRTYE